MEKNNIHVEVAYATEEKQLILSVEVEDNATIETAIDRSGIMEHFPEIDFTQQKVGIFGKVKSLSDGISDGDRIEIYRALLIDPKEARRARAKEKRKL